MGLCHREGRKMSALFFWMVIIYGALRFSLDLIDWAWAKTHPKYRRFVFTSYSGRLWTLKGKSGWLVPSELTDQLQNLHDETGKRPRRKPRLTLGTR